MRLNGTENDKKSMNILYICSRNKWRSRTAETIFKNNGKHNVKSAGTESSAKIRVSQNLLNWADVILVMEEKHRKRILEKFTDAAEKIEVLDIPDDYQYMDEDLIEILRMKSDNIFTEE